MHKTSLIAIAASLTIAASGALAQQPSDPHHPPGGSGQPGAAPAQPPVPPPPAAAPSSPSSAGGMPMMQMMTGQGGMMPMTGSSAAQAGQRMGPTGQMMGDGPGAPINVIINIGPGIRVDTSEAGPARGAAASGRMPLEMMRGARGGMSMPGAGAGAGAAMMPAEHIEGRLAFLRAELGISDAQRDAWERYAQATRAAATRDREARAAAPSMEGGASARLAREEALLAASLERVRTTRAALDALLPALTDAQRRSLDQLLAMSMPGGGPQTGMMSR